MKGTRRGEVGCLGTCVFYNGKLPSKGLSKANNAHCFIMGLPLISRVCINHLTLDQTVWFLKARFLWGKMLSSYPFIIYLIDLHQLGLMKASKFYPLTQCHCFQGLSKMVQVYCEEGRKEMRMLYASIQTCDWSFSLFLSNVFFQCAGGKRLSRSYHVCLISL